MRELTKNRAELLRLFYTNPEAAFYMQEIGRIVGKKPGVFQRTINSMEKEGILYSEYKANARYFKANREYPLFDELKSIVFKTVGVAGSIKDILSKIGSVTYAYIYGSYAKGKEISLSDVDLVIIGNVDENRVVKEFDKLEELLRREINYKLYTLRQFRAEVREKEPFLMEIVGGKKIMIIGDEDDFRKLLKG